MARSREDADDLTQETFMHAYRAIGGFKRRSSFYTWVYRIAVNLTLNFLKKKKREGDRASFEDGAALFDKGEYAQRSQERDSERKELQERLDQAVGGLPLPFRTTFNLVVGQGLSHGQAAEILGCSENTVSWRMYKARKMLQARLATNFSEVGDEM
jgi:RNA polymerase sigma-70 factor (ECF subfamily)